MASAEEDRDRWAAVAIEMGKQLSDIQDVPEDSLAAEIAAVDAEARPMPLEHAMDPAGKKRKAKERAVERADCEHAARGLRHREGLLVRELEGLPPCPHERGAARVLARQDDDLLQHVG